METSGPALTVGAGCTVTSTESSAEQPSLLIAVTEYVVVDIGLAKGLFTEVLLKPIVGLQAQVCAPAATAFSCTLSPGQMLTSCPAFTEILLGEIVMVSEPEHPIVLVTVST
jgi:hypothetical protein